MRLSRVATIGILLGLALILGGCGGGGTSAADKTASATRTVASASSAAAPVRGPGIACRRQLHGFIGAMAKLRGDLARGLSYDDYLREVRAVRVVYARIQPDRLPAGCLLVAGGPAERAFNLYIDAANDWGDCLATVTCSTHTIEPRLQRRWSLASRRLTLARRGLG
jgi:hypothetical protein